MSEYEQATIIEVLKEARQRAASRREEAAEPDAKREFALAITAIEDAMMRVNRGHAIEARTFEETDVEGYLLATGALAP